MVIRDTAYSKDKSMRYVTPPFSRSGVDTQAARDFEDLVDSVYVFCHQTSKFGHNQPKRDPVLG